MLIADWRNNGSIIGPGSAPAFVPRIRAISDSRAMADGPWTVTATCAHCWRTPPQRSCPVGENAGYHCLCAQGWYRTPSKSRNWSCPRCCQEGGYWKAPVLDHMSCVHGRHDAPPGLPRQTPPRPAESTRDALNNIQREIETMNARLAELSLSLRDLLGRQQNAENADGRLGRREAVRAD